MYVGLSAVKGIEDVHILHMKISVNLGTVKL